MILELGFVRILSSAFPLMNRDVSLQAGLLCVICNGLSSAQKRDLQRFFLQFVQIKHCCKK